MPVNYLLEGDSGRSICVVMAVIYMIAREVMHHLAIESDGGGGCRTKSVHTICQRQVNGHILHYELRMLGFWT